MASYSQQYKEPLFAEAQPSPSGTRDSFKDIYLQKPAENPVSPPVREVAESAPEPENTVVQHDGEKKGGDLCPDHLQLHTGVLQQKPRNEIRLPVSEERKLKGNVSELSLVEGSMLGRKRKVRTLYVTSCFNGEGKTTAALNFAYALSSLSGKRVLLLDGNSASPRLHALFGTRQAPGLTDCLRKQVALSSICLPSAYPGLFLVPSGSALNHDLSFFIDQISLLAAEASKYFDYLVWDGTSVLQGSQASALAGCFDGMCMVVECEKTKWEVVQMAREKIENSGGDIVGVVMNKRKFYIPRIVYKFLSNR